MTHLDCDVEVEAHSKIIRDPIYKLERRYSWLSVRSFCHRSKGPTILFFKSIRVYKFLIPKCFDARQHPRRRARFRSGLSEKIECDCFDRIFQDDILIQKDSRIYAAIRQDMLSSIFLFRPLLSP